LFFQLREVLVLGELGLSGLGLETLEVTIEGHGVGVVGGGAVGEGLSADGGSRLVVVGDGLVLAEVFLEHQRDGLEVHCDTARQGTAMMLNFWWFLLDENGRLLILGHLQPVVDCDRHALFLLLGHIFYGWGLA
jgi:hypothetical protein